MRGRRPGRAVAAEEPLEGGGERRLDPRAALEAGEEQRRRLDGRERVAPRLVPEPAVARRAARPEHGAARLQDPGIAPPQGLRLAPAAVEEHDPLELGHGRVLVAERRTLAV